MKRRMKKEQNTKNEKEEQPETDIPQMGGVRPFLSPSLRVGSGGRALTKSKRSLQKNYQIINTQKYPFIKGSQSEAILDFVGSKGPSALSLQG
ncbi:MAG: hypothetical protein PWQ83_2034 [Thermosipho sp. (in: thermotogales)]|nr:hypothetical protein [Thermosipho sp. (in: thermotogales)]